MAKDGVNITTHLSQSAVQCYKNAHVEFIIKVPGPVLHRFIPYQDTGVEHPFKDTIDPNWKPSEGVKFGDGCPQCRKASSGYEPVGDGLVQDLEAPRTDWEEKGDLPLQSCHAFSACGVGAEAQDPD